MSCCAMVTSGGAGIKRGSCGDQINDDRSGFSMHLTRVAALAADKVLHPQTRILTLRRLGASCFRLGVVVCRNESDKCQNMGHGHEAPKTSARMSRMNGSWSWAFATSLKGAT